jgi:hypothetical protein
MTSAGVVTVDVLLGRETVSVALTRIEAQMRATGQASGLLASATSRVAGPMQQTADGALRAAQSEARLAFAMGDVVRAATILKTALAANVGATDNVSNAVQAQLARLQGGTSAFTQFGDAAKNSMLSVVGPAALLAGGIGVLKGAVDSFAAAFKFKAELDATTASINAQLKGVRDTGQVYGEAAAFARQFKLTQQETTEAIAASIGVMRNSKASVEDILGVLARLQVLSPEQSLQEAAVAVKALASGDTTSLVTRFEVGRDVAGQMKREIAGGADAVQVLNKFLNNTGIGMDALAAKTTGVAGKLKDVAIANEQLALAQAQFAQGPGLAILEAQIQATTGATRLLTGDFAAMDQSIRNAAQGGQQLQGLVVAVDAVNAAIGALTQEQGQGTVSAGTWGEATGQLVSSMEAERIAVSQAGLAAQAHSQALIESANTSIADTAAKQEQAAVTALLAAQAQAATDAFIALNPNVSASGAAAAAAAGGLSPLIARLIETTLRANEARGALALLNAMAGINAQRNAPIADRAERDAFKHSNAVSQRQESTAAANAAAAAERRLQAAQGNQIPTIQRLRAEAEALRKTRGADSADYINKLADIAEAEKRGTKKGGGGGGAGGVKLTDQQRLNNTLLADQAKADDRAENLETQHQQKLLDIDRDYQKKQLAQQQANEISKRSSEIDFLKALTSSELNTTKAGRAELARIDAQYYADFDAAQKAAAAGNAAQSEEMVKQAKHRADVELEYAQAIDKAKQKKDGDEVARLEALREKERQLLAEQSKQIAAGGDPNAVARDEALAAEQRSYEEQQGKMITASDQARERKVDNARLSGKAVTDENAALLEQERILNRIGPRPVGVGGPTPPVVPSAGAAALPPITPATAPTASLDTLAAALEGVIGAVNAAKDAITREQGATTSAVRNIKGAVMV